MQNNVVPGSPTNPERVFEIDSTVPNTALSGQTRPPAVLTTVDALFRALVDFKVMISDRQDSQGDMSSRRWRPALKMDELAAAHYPTARPTFVRGKCLRPYAEWEDDWELLQKGLWTPCSNWQRASDDLFRLSEGVVSVTTDVIARSFSAYRRRSTTRDDRGKFAPALCRQWADLDQYSALQVHLDACDEQLK